MGKMKYKPHTQQPVKINLHWIWQHAGKTFPYPGNKPTEKGRKMLGWKNPSLLEDAAVSMAMAAIQGTQRNDGPQGAFGTQANTPSTVKNFSRAPHAPQ